MTDNITFENTMARLARNSPPEEHRDEEFYAIAQLLAEGVFTTEQAKEIGVFCVKMLETDHWWISSGAFNDE